MKKGVLVLLSVIVLTGCATKRDLSYLNSLGQTSGEANFTMDVPYYKIQPRDIIYVSVKTQTADGILDEVLQGRSTTANNMMQSEASAYVSAYSVDPAGMLNIPLLGKAKVAGKNIYEIRDLLQEQADSLFRHSYVEVRLMSYKFTVLGEVRNPGSFINYNDQLTVLEAIGKAGGITDLGSRRDILVVRPMDKTTVTYKINIQDKNLLTSPGYFISPNDVIIIQPSGKKIFNLNLPTYSFVVTAFTGTVTTTLLLINFLK